MKLTKNSAKIFLDDVSPDKRFHCGNGTTFNNLEDLQIALKKMNDLTYSFHANDEKNDFCSWVYDVIGDVKLSDSLRISKDKKSAAAKIRTRITYLKKYING